MVISNIFYVNPYLGKWSPPKKMQPPAIWNPETTSRIFSIHFDKRGYFSKMGGWQQKNTRFHQICRCFIRFSARRFLVPVFTRPCGGLVRFFALDPRWRLGGSEPKGVIEWEIPGNLTASWDPFFANMIFEGRAVKPLGVFPFWGNQSWRIYGNLEGFPVK